MAISIITTSCETKDDYFLNKDTAIYPAFVDNLPYESWKQVLLTEGIADARAEYFQFKATGGVGTYVWDTQPVSGSLPNGLIFTSEGQLKGTPTKEGTFTFELKVTAGAEVATKTFKLTVYPERSRWLRDARYGVTTHWGRFTSPAIYNSYPNNGTDAFEARTTVMKETYPLGHPKAGQLRWGDDWAQQFLNWGAGFIEFSAVWQDSYRNWPNGFHTWKDLHSNIDYLGPLVTAFHERGLKVLSYFPPDYHSIEPGKVPGDKDFDGYILGEHNWGGMNTQLIEELVKVKKIDGLWIDIGGASDLFSFANPGWLYWEQVIPIIRYHNPFFIFGVNPGVRGTNFIPLKFGGTQSRVPYADFVIYESTKDASTNARMASEQATPLISKKKVAIYVSNKVTTSWGWGDSTPTDPIKDATSSIENLANNWAAGATVAMGLPVRNDGLLLDDRFQPIMSAIGNYVTTNKAFSVDPEIIYSGGQVTVTTPTPARVFYTLDGTDPDPDTSRIYLGPIPIDRNTKIKVRTLQPNKSMGFVKELNIESFPAPSQSNLLLWRYPESDTDKDQLAIPYYRGMQFTVGNAPIVITAIGRKDNVGSSVPRNVIIKRYFDEYPIYSGVVKANQVVEADYQFTNISEVRLEAGMTYVVCIQELAYQDINVPEPQREKYPANTFDAPPYNRDMRIIAPFYLSANGDFYPFPNDKLGQIVNLKYRVLSNERKQDVALGKPVRFLNAIGGSTLVPNQYIRYAINATDGNSESLAIAGGLYAYTTEVNLLTLYRINRIAFRFTKYNYATEFEIYASLSGDGSDAVLLWHCVNNRSLDFEYKFDPVLAKYVFIKSIQPSAQGQEGGSMGFESISVYSDQW